MRRAWKQPRAKGRAEFNLLWKVLKGYSVPRKVFARAIRIIVSFKESLSCNKNSLLFLRPKKQQEPLSLPLQDSNLTRSCGIRACAWDPPGAFRWSGAGSGFLLSKRQLWCCADLAEIPSFSSQTRELFRGFHCPTQPYLGLLMCLFLVLCNYKDNE